MDIKKKSFKIPVEWAVFSTIIIEASSLKEAVETAKDTLDNISLPNQSEYIDGSFAVCEGGLEYYEIFNRGEVYDKE